MKQKRGYFVLAVIILGFVSFKTISGNKSAVAQQKKQTVSTRTAAGVSFQYNADGAIQQIIWKENPASVFIKIFSYSGNAITITETFNNQPLKEETIIMDGGQLVSLKGKHFRVDGVALNPYNFQYYYNEAGQVEKVMYGNGAWHKYVYDNQGNLLETNWYNEEGDMIANARKQYFPKTPDQYTQYQKAAKNEYEDFFPAIENKTSPYNRMTDKIAVEISFDGKYAYALSTDGYIKAGKWADKGIATND
jgi:YD repeat-containing protein